jgi:hypothetical protein
MIQTLGKVAPLLQKLPQRNAHPLPPTLHPTCLTVDSRVAINACTAVCRHSVLTDAVITTGIGGTFVDICNIEMYLNHGSNVYHVHTHARARLHTHIYMHTNSLGPIWSGRGDQLVADYGRSAEPILLI